jgi:hypothetical protein
METACALFQYTPEPLPFSRRVRWRRIQVRDQCESAFDPEVFDPVAVSRMLRRRVPNAVRKTLPGPQKNGGRIFEMPLCQVFSATGDRSANQKLRTL